MSSVPVFFWELLWVALMIMYSVKLQYNTVSYCWDTYVDTDYVLVMARFALQLTAPAPYTGGMLPSVHWTIERVIAVGMLPLYPIALYVDGPVMNFIVISAVSMHSYWGFDGVIRDYAFERRYGPALMPALRLIWKVFAGFGFAGLLYFNYNDVGFITGVKKLWAL